MGVKLSIFPEQDGNAMTLEHRVRQIVLTNVWPVDLTTANGEELETCNDEQELRDSLHNRGLL